MPRSILYSEDVRDEGQRRRGAGELFGATVMSIRKAGMVASLILVLFHLTEVYFIQGEEMKKSIGVTAYIECSAKTQQAALDAAIKVVLQPSKQKKKKRRRVRKPALSCEC
ncbi:hypothetical protein T459_03265 [Capsicum annuum]|uniref:Uncharacterized protein n=1 Tax=Capsicum annuum TaxID=4072 RepID=A0A2G3AMK2_CAPAN|nr:hypothetical protein T459_03265 [Capsicum annuum]